MKPSSVTPKPLPDYIQKYAFEFRWDNQLLWKLHTKTEVMGVEQLIWHFDIKWLHTSGGRFDLTPNEIMQNPALYKEQYERTMHSDLNYPIDIMFNKGNWLILDGLHRLMKSVHQGNTSVRVRKISRNLVPQIEIQ